MNPSCNEGTQTIFPPPQLFIPPTLRLAYINSSCINAQLEVMVDSHLSFSKCFPVPETGVWNNVPQISYTSSYHQKGHCMPEYSSQQEVRTWEFSKHGCDLMCNSRQTSGLCLAFFFFPARFIFKKQFEISRWKALHVLVRTLLLTCVNSRWTVYINTIQFRSHYFQQSSEWRLPERAASLTVQVHEHPQQTAQLTAYS